jgi:CRISP-associated protein Cas1
MVSGRNRYATHPINAMLNYAYAVLESQVRISTVAQGLDPMIGYLHACRPGRAALVYDLMEPLRPQVNRLMLDFIGSRTLSPRDFVLNTHGTCRLHPQLAGQVSRLTIRDATVKETVSWLADALRTRRIPTRQ